MADKLNVLIMTDLESLDVGPRSIITQAAFLCVDRDDPDTVIRRVSIDLPIQPQIDAFKRTFSMATLAWWLGQDDKARARFANNTDILSNDLEELLALVRSAGRKIREVITDAASYEVWARGPQFDVVNLESLMGDCGVEVPWSYGNVRDLRTLMALAGLSSKDVDSSDIVPHIAMEDNRFQIRCYVAAMAKLRSKE